MTPETKKKVMQILASAVSSPQWNDEIADKAADVILDTINEARTPRGNRWLEDNTKALLSSRTSQS
jgi:hypothetical protein